MKVPSIICMVARPAETRTIYDNETVTVCPAYPAYYESKTRMASALDWAGKKATQTNFTNLFKDVRIIELEERGEGGRAYKAVVNGKYLVDLREDMVMEVIGSSGIKKGGYMNREFAFGLIGSQVKLLLTTSQVYKDLLLEDKRLNSLQVVKPKELVFGQLYENKEGLRSMYLGMVQTSTYEHILTNEKEINDWERSSYRSNFLGMYGSSRGTSTPKPTPNYETKISKPATFQIWMELEYWHRAKELPHVDAKYISKNISLLKLLKSTSKYTSADSTTTVFANAEEVVTALRQINNPHSDLAEKFNNLKESKAL